MCCKRNIILKSKRFQHDYRNKLVKNISKTYICKCECKYDDRKCDWNQKWNNGKCWCECKIPKNIVCAKKIIFGIMLHVVAKKI